VYQTVVRFDPSGGFVGPLWSPGDPAGTHAARLAFGPDGRLYATSLAADDVRRYVAETGTLVDVFLPVGHGGLTHPWDLAFGADGHLYVADESDTVLRFDGATGAPLGPFVAAGSGGLDNPRALAFHGSGDLLVASLDTDQVLRYSGADGAFVEVFADAGDVGRPAPPGQHAVALTARNHQAIQDPNPVGGWGARPSGGVTPWPSSSVRVV